MDPLLCTVFVALAREILRQAVGRRLPVWDFCRRLGARAGLSEPAGGERAWWHQIRRVVSELDHPHLKVVYPRTTRDPAVGWVAWDGCDDNPMPENHLG